MQTRTIIFIIIAALVISCYEHNIPNQEDGAEANCYLTGYINSTIEYNEQDRVAKIIFIDGLPGGEHWTFNYLDDGKLTSQGFFHAGCQYLERRFTYEGSTIKIVTGTYTEDGCSKNTLTLNEKVYLNGFGKPIARIAYYYLSVQDSIAYTYDEGFNNIVSEKLYDTGTYTGKTEYSYDDKLSPITVFGLGHSNYPVASISKNNITRIKRFNSTNTIFQDQPVGYTYSDRGYPIAIHMEETTNLTYSCDQ
jgi:hypothetical protein